VPAGVSEAESLCHEGDRLAGALAALLVAEPDRPGGRHRYKPQGAAVGAAQGREVDHVGEVARRGGVVVGLRGAPRHGRPGHRDPQGTAGPRPPRGRKDDGKDQAPPSAARILDDIKVALDESVDPGSAKYTALAERIRRLRDRIIQNAQDALDFLAEALRIARAIVNAEKHPDEAVVKLDDDHIGVLSRIIRDHAPPGLTITERNLAEEIDQVVTRTLARSWDNADARSRGVRRATAASSAGTCSSR